MIPYTTVAGARTAVWPNLRRSRLEINDTFDAALLALGDVTVTLTLDPAQAVEITGQGRRAALTTLAITANAPREFLQALLQRTPSGRRSGVR